MVKVRTPGYPNSLLPKSITLFLYKRLGLDEICMNTTNFYFFFIFYVKYLTLCSYYSLKALRFELIIPSFYTLFVCYNLCRLNFFLINLYDIFPSSKLLVTLNLLSRYTSFLRKYVCSYANWYINFNTPQSDT